MERTEKNEKLDLNPLRINPLRIAHFVIKLSMPDEPEGMVLIPAGDGVDTFYIDVYEVTNAEYKRFIDGNPQWRKSRALTAIVDDNYLSGWNGNIYPSGKPDHPVVNVSWFAAIVMHNTEYPRTFEKELIGVLREVAPNQVTDIQDEESTTYQDVILRLWKHYLEIHFQHSSESEFGKLRIFKECLKKNINNIFVQDGR